MASCQTRAVSALALGEGDEVCALDELPLTAPQAHQSILHVLRLHLAAVDDALAGDLVDAESDGLYLELLQRRALTVTATSPDEHADGCRPISCTAQVLARGRGIAIIIIDASPRPTSHWGWTDP